MSVEIFFFLDLICILCLQHKRLGEKIYDMTWYDMPNNNKQLIVIMYQRTQKNISLSSALFTNQIASRTLLSKLIKQVYTLVNLLLNA